MSANKFFLCLLTAAAGLFFSCSRETAEKSEIIIQTSQYATSLTDFVQRYEQFLNVSGGQDNLFMRSSFLKSEIDRLLLLEFADSTGLSRSSSAAASISMAEGQAVLNAFYARELDARYEVPDSTLREGFRRTKIQLHARHLLAPTEEEAQDLRNRLGLGDSFESLAEEVFQDSVLRSSGGDLGFFSYNEMDADFENAAYQLADGEISAPVKTRYGYHIIQVMEHIYEPIITEQDFQLHRGDIEAVERKRQMKTVLREYTDSIRRELDIRISDNDLETLFVNLELIFQSELKELLDDPMLKTIVFSVNGRIWPVQQLMDQMKKTRSSQRSKISSLDDLYQVLEGLAIRQTILDRALKTEWVHSEEFRTKLIQARQDRIIQLTVNEIYGSDDQAAEPADRQNRYHNFVSALRKSVSYQYDQKMLEGFQISRPDLY